MKRKYHVPTTKTQRKNLRKLATYLWNLPDDYKHFGMISYLSSDSCSINTETPQELPDNPCGTAACAVGHGPSAGIRPHADDRDWTSYGERAFVGNGEDEWGLADEAYNFMFSGGWSRFDNTAKGAAKRIWYFLKHNMTGVVDPEYDMQYKMNELMKKYEHFRPA